MKLPKELPKQSERTLIFVSDSTRAKWYLADERDMKKMGSFLKPKPEYTDREGDFSDSMGNRHSRAPKMDVLAVHEERMFCKEVIKQLENALRSTKAQRIIVAMPAAIKKQVERLLPANIKNKIKQWHVANLYRFSGIDIAHRLLK